jgi:hypothetical protein
VGGNDLIQGAGRNTSFGDAFEMSGHARGGNDTITSLSAYEYSAQYGDAQYMSDHARGGNDTLTGSDDAISNALYGDAQDMSGSARGGGDTLTGGRSRCRNGPRGATRSRTPRRSAPSPPTRPTTM